MPSNDEGLRFRDILDNIARIRRHLAGMTFDQFIEDDAFAHDLSHRGTILPWHTNQPGERRAQKLNPNVAVVPGGAPKVETSLMTTRTAGKIAPSTDIERSPPPMLV